MLIPYGAHNPSNIDPALYPHRKLILWQETRVSAPTLMMWFDNNPLPLDEDVTDALQNIAANKASILLMARTPDVLARVVEAIDFLFASASGSIH